MNFKLPTIDKTKQPEEEDYNFVNTKERRKTKELTSPPLGIIDELKRKIEEQRREIQTRNNAIMAIQRNFESMAALLKTEKTEGTRVREELDRLKKTFDDNGKRAIDFHQKNIQLTNELKQYQGETSRLIEENRNLGKQLEVIEKLQKSISTLEAQNRKLKEKAEYLESSTYTLNSQLKILKDAEREQRNLQSRIVDLEEELKQLRSERNDLHLSSQKWQDQNRILDSSVKRLEDYVETLKRKNMDEKSKEQSSYNEIGVLKNKIVGLEEEVLKLRTETENKDVVIMMKLKTEEELKNNIVDLKVRVDKANSSSYQKNLEVEAKNKVILGLEAETREFSLELSQVKARNETLLEEMMKGESKDQQMQNILSEFSQLRHCNKVLEKEATDFKSQIKELQHTISKYQPHFSEIDKHLSVKILDANDFDRMEAQLEQYQMNASQLENEKQGLNGDLVSQSEEIRRMSKLLQQYRQEEEDLKKILDQEKSKMSVLEVEKNLTEQEVEREKQNNKMLWADNRKLKEKEKLLSELENTNKEISIKSQRELEELERLKDNELLQKTSKLKEDYEKQFQLFRNSNNDQLSNLLKKKSEAVDSLEERLRSLSEELEFYKNRNKELEGVGTRAEKKLKEMENTFNDTLTLHQKAQAAIAEEHRLCGQSVKSLTDRLSSLEAYKKQFLSLEEERKSLELRLTSLTAENLDIKKRLGAFENEDYSNKKRAVDDKVRMLQKSVGDLFESLVAVKNHISCNHCGQLPVESTKLIPCGHIYCKKCKEGYEGLCEECKRSGDPVADKPHDQTVVKLNYMQMILMSVKEETQVLSNL